MSGPPPKRSSERRRRNHVELDTVTVDGQFAAAPAPDEVWHSLARDWYLSLVDSAQARFYESSDWHTARLCAAAIHDAMTAEAMPATLLAQIRGLMTDLLVTEGARRRVRIEIERQAAESDDGVVTELEQYRHRAAGAG